MKTINPIVVILIFASFIFGSCSKSNNSIANTGTEELTSNISIKLTDGPGFYDAVNVDLKEIQLNMVKQGWITLPLKRVGTYNLLKLSNGVDTLICQSNVPVGIITDIRLILGNNNSVVYYGVSYALNTPSAAETTLKLNLASTNLQANNAYSFWFDFDAGKSITSTANGFVFKPVIRAFSPETNGKVKGSVLPISKKSVVYVTNSTESYSAIPDATGNFLINGVAEGTYTVRIHPTEGAGISDAVYTKVVVKYGATTDVGTTNF